MHQPTTATRISSSRTAAAASRRRFAHPYVPSVRSSSPSSVIYGGTAFPTTIAHNGAPADFWPGAMTSIAAGGKEKEEKSARVHGTLCLILCVVLLNLVALLCVVHFKLLLVVSPRDAAAASRQNSSFFSFPKAQNNMMRSANSSRLSTKSKHRELTRATNGENQGNGREVPATQHLEIDSSAKVHPQKWKPELPGAENQQGVEAIGNSQQTIKSADFGAQQQEKAANGMTKGEREREAKSSEREGRAEETAQVLQIPLPKVGFQLSKEPVERKLMPNNGGHLENDAQQLAEKLPACPPCSPSAQQLLGPIQPVNMLQQIPASKASDLQAQNKFLIDCQNQEDSQGTQRCAEWRRAGYCEDHPATKWLFCRRQCLCSSTVDGQQ